MAKEELSVDQQFIDDFIARGGHVKDVATDKTYQPDKKKKPALTPKQEKEFERDIHDLRENEEVKGTASDILEKEKEKAAKGESVQPELTQAVLKTKAAPVSTTEKAEKLHKKADDHLEKERPTDSELAKEKSQRQSLEKAKISDRARTIGGVASSVSETISEKIDPTAQKIGSMPTPGGLGLLVAILLVLLWIVIPVNTQGDTRLKLLWYTLGGRTTLTGAINPSLGSGQGAGSSLQASDTSAGPVQQDVTASAVSFTATDSPVQYRSFTGGF